MRLLFAVLIAGLVGVAPACAQDWPTRQVTIVVPFGAGGSADLLARILATHMQAKFGQAVVVENRAGAGGSIGTNYVAKAAPEHVQHEADGQDGDRGLGRKAADQIFSAGSRPNTCRR